MNNHINTNHLSKQLNCERRMIMKKYALKITTLLAALTLCLSCVTPTYAYQTIRNGSRSEDARVLQHYLNVVMNPSPNLVEDGIAGAKTIGAVKQFQRENGLADDGIAGYMTWQALTKAYERASCARLHDATLLGVYYIVSKADTNMVLDAAGAATSNGTNICVWTRHGGPNQQVAIYQRSDGSLVFAFAHALDKVFDVDMGSRNAQIWDGWYDANQQMALEGTGDGTFIIKLRGSNLCLDIEGGSAWAGCNVIAYPVHYGDNQRWYLEAVPASALSLELFQQKALSTWVRPVKATIKPISNGRQFGATRGNRHHAAVDWFVAGGDGTPVYAMEDGTVVEYCPGFYAGTDAVAIRHPDGSIARYCEIRTHLRLGNSVSKGAQIGTIIPNNTEDGGTMLHLELYRGDGTGNLSNTSNHTFRYVSGNFQRRSDLLDPTFLCSLT